MAEIRPVKNSLIDEDRPNVNEKVPIQRMPFCNCAQNAGFSRSRLPLRVLFKKIYKPSVNA